MTNKTDILLVEDDPNDEELILRVIRKRGLEGVTTVVHNGQEALDFLFEGNEGEEINTETMPRIILLDLKLPKMGGLEVLQALRVHNQTRLVPVVVFSSSTEQTDILASYDLGANSYVRKAVDYQEFVSSLDTLIDYWLNLNMPLPAH